MVYCGTMTYTISPAIFLYFIRNQCDEIAAGQYKEHAGDDHITSILPDRYQKQMNTENGLIWCQSKIVTYQV